MILLNPKSDNRHPFKAIEPPIWCLMLAQDGDEIIDNEVEPLQCIAEDEDVLIVVMGNNPSVSSTPKMTEAQKLLITFPHAKITGLHPMATGEATYQIPPPEELVKIKRAKWELLDMTLYKAHNWHCLHDVDNRGNYASLYTSFGCPFNCSFCNIHTIYKGRQVYYRSPQDVIDEIGLLVNEYGIKNLKICDEMFTLNHKHVTAICSGIAKYNLNIWAYARVGTVTPELLKTMKGAGINWLCYGFESGNQGVMRGVSKKYGDIQKSVDMTRHADINILGNFMFGLPDDTLETMNDTLRLAQELNCEYVNFYCAMAYPGSDIYKGDNKDWDTYNQYGNTAVPSWVKSFRDDAFNQYFSNPIYLSMVKERFGNRAVAHIKEMVNGNY